MDRIYDDNFVDFLNHFEFGESWSLEQNEIDTIYIDEKFAIVKANAVSFVSPFADFVPFSRGSKIVRFGIEYDRIGRSKHGFISYVRADADEDVYIVYENAVMKEIFESLREAEDYVETSVQ